MKKNEFLGSSKKEVEDLKLKWDSLMEDQLEKVLSLRDYIYNSDTEEASISPGGDLKNVEKVTLSAIRPALNRIKTDVRDLQATIRAVPNKPQKNDRISVLFEQILNSSLLTRSNHEELYKAFDNILDMSFCVLKVKTDSHFDEINQRIVTKFNLENIPDIRDIFFDSSVPISRVNRDGRYVGYHKVIQDNIYHQGNDHFDPAWYQDFYFVFEHQGLAALAFWTGSLFAEQIRQKQEGYTLLEISGDRETGKTTLTKILWRLLGVSKYEGVDPLKMNDRALARKFAQAGNIPLVMIEGDRNESKKKSMFDYDWLKTTWEGGTIRGTGFKNHGLETNEDPFKGSAMVVQNMTIDGSDALLSRFVHLHMNAKDYSADVEKAIYRLRETDIEMMAAFRNRILCHEPELLKAYFNHYNLAHQKLIERANREQIRFTPRVIQNHAQILAWAYSLQPVFKGEITDMQLSHFESYLWGRCLDRQRRLQTEHPLLQQFWDYYDKLNWKTVHQESGTTHNVEILNHLPGSGRIAINLTDFDELCGEHKLQRIDINELKQLIPNSVSRRYIENKPLRSKQANMNGRTRRCWIFNEVVNG